MPPFEFVRCGVSLLRRIGDPMLVVLRIVDR
jgi:hypothetical protein